MVQIKKPLTVSANGFFIYWLIYAKIPISVSGRGEAHGGAGARGEDAEGVAALLYEEVAEVLPCEEAEPEQLSQEAEAQESPPRAEPESRLPEAEAPPQRAVAVQPAQPPRSQQPQP